MKTLNLTILVFLTVPVFTGCLKTRVQLREEASDERGVAAYKPVPAQPAQEVLSQYALDEIKITLTQLEGRVQEMERTHQDPKGSAPVKKLEFRIQQIEQSLATLIQSHTSLEQAQAAFGGALKELQENHAISNPDEVYKQAKSEFDSGNYTTAAESLATYLKIPKAKKIEEAIFMRATSLFKLKQYKKAIVDFSKFPEKYPKSLRTPEALYKIGLCFDALDMKEDARGFYQEIVEKYPKSPEAKKAKKKAK